MKSPSRILLAVDLARTQRKGVTRAGQITAEFEAEPSFPSVTSNLRRQSA